MNSNFIHIENNTFLGSNGVFGVAYQIEPLQKYSLGSEDFESVHQMWVKAFSLLENAVIVKMDVYLPDTYDTSKFEDLNFLQNATKDYYKDRPCLEHRTYIFFLKPDFDTFLNANWHNPFKWVKKGTFEKLEQEQIAFVQEVKNAVAFVEGKKFSNNDSFVFNKLSEKELIAFENLYFSGLAEGFTTNIFTQNKEVYTGDKHIGVFSVDNEANFSSFLHDSILDKDYSTNKYKYYKNYADNFSFNLDFAHIYSQVFFIDAHKRTVNELERSYDNLFRNRSWNRQNELSAQQVKEVLEDLIKNEERRIIRGSVSVMIFEEDAKVFQKQKDAVVNAFNELDITPHYLSNTNRRKSDYYLHFPVFSPYMNDKQLFKLPLDCACCMISNTGHYKDDEQGILFTSRIDNRPTIVDTYFEDKKYENARNAMLIASTGHGKSTLINHLVRNYYEAGEKVVIIDYGGSYKKLAEFYNNDVSYITYKEGNSLGINIFDLGLENGVFRELTSDELDKITDYILIHTGVEHPKEEIDVLKKLVEKYYNTELEVPNFHGFYEFLNYGKTTLLQDLGIDSKYFDINRFLLVTEQFSSKGKLGFIYNQEAEAIFNQDIEKAITIFEFENATQNEIILQLLLFLTDVIIDKQILKDESVRGHIIFDEIAKMYKFKGILEKVELFYQTVRKKEAEITQVLQTIHQLPKSEAGKAIIENTQVLYVLYAKDYEPIKQAFNLSQHAIYEMQSLQGKFKGEKPYYSEIWLLRGEHHAVYRLELPPEVYWAYQTEGKKNALLMNYLEEYGNLEMAIEKMISLEESGQLEQELNQIKNE